MVHLEGEIRRVLASLGGQGQWPDIIMARHGWDGRPPKTLEMVGEEFGLTRERIRQVSVGVRKRYSERARPLMPRLEEALLLLQESVPCRTASIRERLIHAGISNGHVGGEGLLEAADFFEYEVDVVLARTESDSFLVGPELAGCVGNARKVARKLIGAHGVTTAAEVAAEACGEIPAIEQDNYEELVRLELESEPDVAWLDNQKRWLWLRGIPKGRNRMLNNIRKILSVALSIDAVELRRALRRDWRMGGYAPPAPILLALADVVPELSRAGSIVEAVESYSREEHLSPSERAIAEALMENGAVMRYEEIKEAVREKGVGMASFRRRMSHSPVVRKYAPGIYGLSGVKVTGAEVEALVRPAKWSSVMQDCGWTNDGCIWVAYKLSKNTLEAAVLGIPAAVRDFIVGEHQLQGPSGRDFGVLVVKASAAWGVRRFLRISGAETGDTLVLVFDLSERACKAYLGDDSVRDEVLTD